MSESLPRDVQTLRALEAELAARLTQVRTALADAEDHPRWWVQRMRRGRAARVPRGYLHRAGCWMPGEPDLTRRAAASALADPRIEGCGVCDPGPALGFPSVRPPGAASRRSCGWAERQAVAGASSASS
ncbi:DUF6233 domain-containing protein [Streptomyces sp. NPDC048636]|uniref:DUF6233 domain-containing protein n=1 Tax=Streptomyces sp. NPDC048636 TaxID=3155762 RepID=UPI00342B21CD